MEKQLNYNRTRYACYAGYFVQAIINNLSPILFVVFQKEFNLSYSAISNLVLINFLTQLAVDVIAVKLVDKIGVRFSICTAHVLAFCGLMLLGILPATVSTSFIALVIPTVIYAMGSGLIEVLVSPIVESLPSEHKSSSMSLLHSFYCWGQVVVVLFTTVLLKLIGANLWFLLPVMWSLIPLVNFFTFLKVPLVKGVSESERVPLKQLFSSRMFLVACIMMLCAGASELTMSQWSSLFAEQSLGVSKVLGDIAGPCLFAVLMGTGRLLYGIFGIKINIDLSLKLCMVLCVVSYLITGISKNPVLAFIGCGLCGFSVSLMWPGVFSISAKYFPNGGTAMFALLAVFGDLGCSLGPWLAGQISSAITNSKNIVQSFPGFDISSIALKIGVLSGVIFPLIMFISSFFMKKRKVKG